MAKFKVCLDCAREYPASGVDRPKLSSAFGRPYLASHGPGLCVLHMQLGMSLYIHYI